MATWRGVAIKLMWPCGGAWPFGVMWQYSKWLYVGCDLEEGCGLVEGSLLTQSTRRRTPVPIREPTATMATPSDLVFPKPSASRFFLSKAK